MAKLELDSHDLRPIVEVVVSETLAALETTSNRLNGRLGFREAEAAKLLGVKSHVLRDVRLRGEIDASRVGKSIVYSPNDITEYLLRNRWRRS